jgi:hypothetical protein
LDLEAYDFSTVVYHLVDELGNKVATLKTKIYFKFTIEIKQSLNILFLKLISNLICVVFNLEEVIKAERFTFAIEIKNDEKVCD